MHPDTLVRDIDTLFSMPEVALRLNQLINDPETTPADLAEVLRCDPALSARLLRLVNSAGRAQVQAIETVGQAIGLIGYRALRDLVFATCAVEMFEGLPPERVNMERFWLRSVACAIAARYLAQRSGQHNGERLFIIGLLHGLGQLVFFARCPERYLRVLERVDTTGMALTAAEHAEFGFDADAVSATLLKHWHFPESIREPIACRLHPEQASTAERTRDAAILGAAASISRELRDCLLEQRAPDPALLHEQARALGLVDSALDSMPEAINLEVVELFETLLPGSTLLP
ncbi:HDOD domain-containing protein [Marichromatium bheemlicum]|uniref:HDOD domain-containing protein n=1 Tax=Marichromatium bheemlicum TaxID=365339 RepID=A0ABX1I6Z6_9GAMM|nr:HDOD domain-containing protein [Marichromatium bheemlicum]NKN32819.1 HDOD domain-containing protein [Marichromatium bheemlicum]